MSADRELRGPVREVREGEGLLRMISAPQSSAVAAWLIACFSCLILSDGTATLYRGPFSSHNWQPDPSLSSSWRDSAVKFTVALKLRNTERMEEHFRAVSDPTSASYGQYLSASEIDQVRVPRLLFFLCALFLFCSSD